MALRVNIPPLTRILLVSCVALSVANAIVRRPDLQTELIKLGAGAPYLSIIPTQSIIFPWVYVTASFVERNLFGLIGSGLTLFFGGRYLERAWGSSEFAKFVLVSTIVPNVLAAVQLILLYVVTGNHHLLHSSISGALPLQGAFLVSLKQLVPEHTVSLLRDLIRVRVKHFPAIFLLLNTISAIVLNTHTALILSWTGFFSSWAYLRFYRASPSTLEGGEGVTIKGDASDTFAFAYFFPEPIHTPLARVCDRVYEVLVALRVCTPFSAAEIETGNAGASQRSQGGSLNVRGAHGFGGGRREEAERRRALALRALDQKLGTAGAGRGLSGPPATVTPTVTPSVVTQQAGLAGSESPAPPTVLGGMDYKPDQDGSGPGA